MNQRYVKRRGLARVESGRTSLTLRVQTKNISAYDLCQTHLILRVGSPRCHIAAADHWIFNIASHQTSFTP
jgi:hypothetical protein